MPHTARLYIGNPTAWHLARGLLTTRMWGAISGRAYCDNMHPPESSGEGLPLRGGCRRRCLWRKSGPSLPRSRRRRRSIQMMACHHVRPRGMRALPVRNVAMLQLISSPGRFHQHNKSSPSMGRRGVPHRSCGTRKSSMSAVPPRRAGCRGSGRSRRVSRSRVDTHRPGDSRRAASRCPARCAGGWWRASCCYGDVACLLQGQLRVLLGR